MSKLRLSARAEFDLEEIQEIGVRDFGVSAAREHMAGFERIFTLLREHPSAGQEQPSYGRRVRSFSHKPHRILYRIDDTEVLIIRILHMARDVKRALRSKR